jgi:hypothetical protein
MNSIPLVPVTMINPPWDEAIEAAQKITPPPDTAISSAHAASHKYAKAIWLCSCHWLYKLKWNRQHKIPFGVKGSKPLEPLGWLLWSLLELCKEVHSYPCNQTKTYSHASEWFGQISHEIRELYLWNGNKSEILQKLRQDLKKLKACENPYSLEKNPHLYRLVAMSLKLAANPQYPEFEQVYLRSEGKKKGRCIKHPGFIQALSTWATEVDRNPNLVTYFVKEPSTGNKVTNPQLIRYHNKSELPTPLEIPTIRPKNRRSKK